MLYPGLRLILVPDLVKWSINSGSQSIIQIATPKDPKSSKIFVATLVLTLVLFFMVARILL